MSEHVPIFRVNTITHYNYMYTLYLESLSIFMLGGKVDQIWAI